MVAATPLRSATQAFTAFSKLSSSAWLPRRQARTSTLNSISDIFSQLPCLSVWWNFGCLAIRRASDGGKVS